MRLRKLIFLSLLDWPNGDAGWIKPLFYSQPQSSPTGGVAKVKAQKLPNAHPTPNPAPSFGKIVPLYPVVLFSQVEGFMTLPGAVAEAPPAIPHPIFPSVEIPELLPV